MSKPSSPKLRTRLYEQESTEISRREFGRRAALAAALYVSPAPPLADSATLSRMDGAIETPTVQTGAAQKLSAEQAQEVEAKLANIIRKYGSRLTAAQRDHLRRILTYNEKMLASIRSFPLENGDPPASVLRISFTGESPKRNSAPSGRVAPNESCQHSAAGKS